MSDSTTEKLGALLAPALLLTSLVSAPALAQQDRNLYFQSPDGSINIIVPSGPGYVITPFRNGSGGYDGYTVTPSSPPPYYAPPPASLYLGQPSPSYQYEYQRRGPAGCVYGCTGERLTPGTRAATRVDSLGDESGVELPKQLSVTTAAGLPGPALARVWLRALA
jgi:hypothetical protein